MFTNLKNNILTNMDFDSKEAIAVDFSNIKSIALKDVKQIAQIHKIAILNGKKLYIKNATPEIMNVLALTGLYKSFINFEDVQITPDKRQRII